MTELSDLDESTLAAIQDVATVRKDGTRLDTYLDGVRTFAPTVHVDHRGRLFEVYPGQNEFCTEPVVYCYAWSVRPGTMKGWGLHLEKSDRYTLLAGEAVTVLFDARLDSPTHGKVQKVFLTEQGIRQVSIPTGIWHLTVNLADRELCMINHPTRAYRHDNPDRMLLEWDSPLVTFDLRSLFPIQVRTSASRGED
jgi:dTDP-4-dehydrorhamnose 3,5-epimerase